jgi:very-short-patch-repair endonuclease
MRSARPFTRGGLLCCPHPGPWPPLSHKGRGDRGWNRAEEGRCFSQASAETMVSVTGNEEDRVHTGQRWAISPALRKRMAAVAHDLRVRQTAGEAVLWELLRDRRLSGRKFRRQQPVGPFVLDFYCAEERLAVEVDGGIHNGINQAHLDRERQQLIESLGIRFVRVSNEDVLHNSRSVLKKISAQFNESAPADPPHPTQPPIPSPLVGEGCPKGGVRARRRRRKLTHEPTAPSRPRSNPHPLSPRGRGVPEGRGEARRRRGNLRP